MGQKASHPWHDKAWSVFVQGRDELASICRNPNDGRFLFLVKMRHQLDNRPANQLTTDRLYERLELTCFWITFPFQMEQWSTITSLIYKKNFWVRHDGPEREN